MEKFLIINAVSSVVAALPLAALFIGGGHLKLQITLFGIQLLAFVVMIVNIVIFLI